MFALCNFHIRIDIRPNQKAIFKDIFFLKIDHRVASVCSSDKKLARSLAVSALRKIVDDIEKDNFALRHKECILVRELRFPI